MVRLRACPRLIRRVLTTTGHRGALNRYHTVAKHSHCLGRTLTQQVHQPFLHNELPCDAGFGSDHGQYCSHGGLSCGLLSDTAVRVSRFSAISGLPASNIVNQPPESMNTPSFLSGRLYMYAISSHCLEAQTSLQALSSSDE